MTAEERLVQLLSDGEVPVVQGVYYGAASRYITFDLVSFGAAYGDDEPQAIRQMAEIRYTCPASESASAARARIARALTDAGFLFPQVSREETNGNQTLIFETEFLSGTDWEV